MILVAESNIEEEEEPLGLQGGQKCFCKINYVTGWKEVIHHQEQKVSFLKYLQESHKCNFRQGNPVHDEIEREMFEESILWLLLLI